MLPVKIVRGPDPFTGPPPKDQVERVLSRLPVDTARGAPDTIPGPREEGDAGERRGTPSRGPEAAKEEGGVLSHSPQAAHQTA
ncbi:hypothetical protein NDU88_005359 [Pleurodeles waltl]|uniref:Uncharacterized protein n=1 Tax=Pleurodeles waltl TaxID=8319 RepID=A0AAV7UHU9_PLEWA|nr:hypothetical protein NDU88_005359 [Pleurodeles waltl]